MAASLFSFLRHSSSSSPRVPSRERGCQKFFSTFVLLALLMLGTVAAPAQAFAAAEAPNLTKIVGGRIPKTTVVPGISTGKGVFDQKGNDSGAGWIKMLRGNFNDSDWNNGKDTTFTLDKFGNKVYDPFDMTGNLGCFFASAFGGGCGGGKTAGAPIADAGSSKQYMAALRMALSLYSNALLIVGSFILLYHLLIMTAETAHSGIAGGKRANQVWAPIRLVMAIGLLVPLSDVGLNSAQYISLQIIEWGSNMATHVWSRFKDNAGSGAGTTPTPHVPDTIAIAREAAKIGACMGLVNKMVEATGGDMATEGVRKIPKPPATLWGNDKNQALCGSTIEFAGGAGNAAAMEGIDKIIEQVVAEAPKFIQGEPDYNKVAALPDLSFAAVIGTMESVSGGWNNGSGSAGAGWVAAGAYFLELAQGGSNNVSGTDTLPIIMGPQAEKIRPAQYQQAFYRMAEWIVGTYKDSAGGGGADPGMVGNTVAGRKFVDLMLLFVDQVGVISGLWAPGSAAFMINLDNSPLAEMVDLGHRMIRTALDFVGLSVEIGVNAPQHAAYSALIDKTNDSGKSGQFFGMMAIPLLSAAASALITMGLMLGIFAPMLPFVKFVLSVLTWLTSVVETMVCVPLLALAYLSPYGEGFGGQKVEPGYYLILHAFLRPVMTIFGLVAAILLFNIAAHLVTTFYYAITSNAGTFNGGMYVVAKIGFGMMYVSVLYLCLNTCLKIMDTFGKHATRWMGGQSHEEMFGDGQQAVGMAQQGTAMLSQGLSGMANNAIYAGRSGGLPPPGADGKPDPLRQQQQQQHNDTGKQLPANQPGDENTRAQPQERLPADKNHSLESRDEAAMTHQAGNNLNAITRK